jgi:DNA-binding response OmpR family regulator
MSHVILVVEDEPTMLRGISDALKAKGFSVLTAPDGEKGLELATSSRPDLILLDVMLPKVNGYEVCRLLREEGLDVPVIMLTAKDQESDIVLGLNLGADDYVTKPFSVRELMARVNAFLRRRQAAEAAVVAFGDCELRHASRQLVRQGTEVALTPKEYGLLEFLVKRAGRAVSRDEILTNVWGYDVNVTGRSVDRCVTTLRAKIEPDPTHPTFLKTVRDVGYRFEIAE